MMRAKFNYILGIILLMCPAPVTAELLWSCDFEPKGKNCLTGKAGNEIKTFEEFGIPPLPGGGKYAITAKNKRKVLNSDNLDFYYKSHLTQNIYVRVYVYFPKDWKANGHTDLKWLGVRTAAKSSCGPCVWTMMYLKIAQHSDGSLYLYHRHAGNVRTKGARVDKEITREQWHYVEFHVQNVPDGEDIVETWIDADARTQKPTTRQVFEIYEAPDDTFGVVHMNINWSGGKPPRTQQYYVDGLATSKTPIGDAYGLTN